MITIANHFDFNQICKIHKSVLPKDFLSGLSDRFLIDFFYPMFIKDSIFLVWKERGVVEGFLVIVLETKKINKYLFYNINTAKEIIFTFFKRPIFIITNVLGILFSHMQIQQEFKNSPEIYLLAIDNLYQSQGIGSQLVHAGMKYLDELNYQKCIVKTSLKKASLFYQKNHFEVIGKEIRFNKTLKILGRN